MKKNERLGRYIFKFTDGKMKRVFELFEPLKPKNIKKLKIASNTKKHLKKHIEKVGKWIEKVKPKKFKKKVATKYRSHSRHGR